MTHKGEEKSSPFFVILRKRFHRPTKAVYFAILIDLNRKVNRFHFFMKSYTSFFLFLYRTIISYSGI